MSQYKKTGIDWRSLYSCDVQLGNMPECTLIVELHMLSGRNKSHKFKAISRISDAVCDQPFQQFVRAKTTGCLQTQPNKFPGDFQDTSWIKLHNNHGQMTVSRVKDITRFGSVIGIISYLSWQLNFPGASIKFQEISRISRTPRSCRHREPAQPCHHVGWSVMW